MRTLILIISICFFVIKTNGQQKKDEITLLNLTDRQKSVFEQIMKDYRDSVMIVAKKNFINYEERRQTLEKLALGKSVRIDSLLEPSQRQALKEYFLKRSEGKTHSVSEKQK